MPRLAYIVKQMMCLKQTQSLMYCYSPEIKIYESLNKHPGFLSVIKLYTSNHEKGFWNS